MGRDIFLETFKLKESSSNEASQSAGKLFLKDVIISQQTGTIKLLENEVAYLKKGMWSFIQGEEGIKLMTKNTNALLDKWVGLNFNKKEKARKYDGKHDISYDYAMSGKIRNKCLNSFHFLLVAESIIEFRM